jgi:Major Facilitator Superfamily
MNVMTEQTLTEPVDERQELSRGFSRYQSILVALLALVQFTIIIDFMIMSPLGAIIMPALNISAAQFGVAVSAYAFSAGISGILAAGFADQFDRKWLLLFFYVGFTLGTALCAIAPNYHVLLLGRIVTGLFGGVIGSVVLAIVTDLFALQLRGDGLRTNGLRREPGAWHPSRSFSLQSLELARRVWRIGRPVDRRHGRRAVFDEAGERPSAAKARQKRLPASDRNGRTATLLDGIRGDDAAGDRRLHADALRQRLYRA